MLVRKVILCYARSNLSEDKQSEALSERKTNSYAVSEGVKKATHLRNFIPHAQDLSGSGKSNVCSNVR